MSEPPYCVETNVSISLISYYSPSFEYKCLIFIVASFAYWNIIWTTASNTETVFFIRFLLAISLPRSLAVSFVHSWSYVFFVHSLACTLSTYFFKWLYRLFMYSVSSTTLKCLFDLLRTTVLYSAVYIYFTLWIPNMSNWCVYTFFYFWIKYSNEMKWN